MALAGVVVAMGVWLGAGGVAWGNSVTPMCQSNGATATCGAGWYTSPVSLYWAVDPIPVDPSSSCIPFEQQGPFASDSVTELSCTVSWPSPGPTVTQPYTLKIEISNPTASPTPSRPPDSNGWYNHPVAVNFGGSAFSGIASCVSRTYAGPDTPSTTIAGTCTDNAGKTAAAGVSLHYDATPPTITATKPSRPPDHHGWYNHPVTFAFAGTDATSGISSCTNVAYGGPSSAGASTTGSCTDRAGNVGTLAVPLRYDSKPPPVKARATTGDGFVSLHWLSGGDVAPMKSIKVMRSPGLNRPHSVVYRGHGSRVYDGRITNGRRYAYTIRVIDQAGNVTKRTTHITAGPHIILPARRAHTVAPPLLTWTPVRHADYYNVQLYRGRHKVLSIWPGHSRLQLQHAWRFQGRRYGLRPGLYRWWVWPGFGQRSAGRYGKAIGSGTFVMTGTA